ncbi:MAG: DUF4911 domain-containing protein [Desulfovibrio sp.]|nr:DUF4911 domain-containing protein [Desulfovibrio sp.]
MKTACAALSASPLPEQEESDFLLIRLAREHTALFRFLLESYENLAYFTVLERKTALLKLVFSPHQRGNVLRALEEIVLSVPLDVQEWPFCRNNS